LAFDSANQLILESIGDSKGYLLKSGDSKFALFPWLFAVTAKYDVAFSLIGPLSTNFYHWLNDMAPTLEALVLWESRSGCKAKIIIDNLPPPFQRELWELLGFGGHEVVEWTHNRAKVSRLIVGSRRYGKVGDDYWAKYLLLSKESLRWLRSGLPPFVRGGIKLYISRRDASSRRIANEQKVEALLGARGFQIVTLSDLTLKEQISLFSRAKTVITVHGAALAHSIFVDNINVIELFPATRSTRSTMTFYQIAHFFNHHFVVLESRVVNDMEDIEVDLNLLEMALESIK
jgi:hypothetical protein